MSSKRVRRSLCHIHHAPVRRFSRLVQRRRPEGAVGRLLACAAAWSSGRMALPSGNQYATTGPPHQANRARKRLQPACLGQRIELEAVTADSTSVGGFLCVQRSGRGRRHRRDWRSGRRAGSNVDPADGRHRGGIDARRRVLDQGARPRRVQFAACFANRRRERRHALRISRQLRGRCVRRLSAASGGAARRFVPRQAERLSISNLIDTDWHNGISRRPVETMLGVVRCAMPAGSSRPSRA